jgi:hypothetical protein
MAENNARVDDEVARGPAGVDRHLSSTIVVLGHALEEREAGHNAAV